MAALERLKEKQKFNILVICATGYGSAQMLKNRIDNELVNLVHIVDVIGYYELSDERLKILILSFHLLIYPIWSSVFLFLQSASFKFRRAKEINIKWLS